MSIPPLVPPGPVAMPMRDPAPTRPMAEPPMPEPIKDLASRAAQEDIAAQAVAEITERRRRLAQQVGILPPPLDTRLALLASIAEIRQAIVPPRLVGLDRRR